MKRNGLLLLLGLACMGARAQHRLPANYSWQRLENGLEVVVIENHRVPLATIEIAVKNGAYTEGPEYSGLSHLFEHMFFKANKDYPDQEKFIRRTEELGAIWNGTTDVERVNYFFTFAKDSLEAGLRFMNAAMRYPIYRAEDMTKERPVVDGEFQRAESDPGFQLWHESQKRLWGELVTRKNPIGEHDVINTATPEKMMIIKDKYYHPNNSLLIIAGDVTPNEAFRLARNVWGDWAHSGFNPLEKYPIPPFQPLAKTDYFIKQSSIAQTPYMMLSWQGPSFADDSANTVVADVFSAVLRLNASKWKQALVDKGLAPYADMGYSTCHYTGPIAITVVPTPTKLEECYRAMMDQIAHFGDEDYISEELLQTAKEVIRRNEIRSKEKPSSLPMQLSYQWASTSLEYYTDYEANLMRVTRADLRNYVKRYITGKPFVAGLILNEEMAKTARPETFFKN
ncbi:M16 family metallopeptidase [Flaviaesturariibacter aridisoli]|uniref:Insulinase family protein n=1 Tax=Flaviaesturariibacter aridisoli TaxID=2545761 RepID=A0A4R4E036_9BACT|nr:pitrilysin family protein [Flaviaesturariibacter aridisoli]TCZ69907.1 insulinase family protein [Flaviaesturariibacter aridisoli]